jgi:hypothetical protein
MSDDDPMHHFMDGMKKKLLKGQGKYFFLGETKIFYEKCRKKSRKMGARRGSLTKIWKNSGNLRITGFLTVMGKLLFLVLGVLIFFA